MVFVCKTIKDYKKEFKFDYIDGTNVPKFTNKNLALIEVFIEHNSSYSAASEYENILDEKKEDFFDFEEPREAPDGTKKDDIDEEGNLKTDLYRVIEAIDRVNSTHLASEGNGATGEGKKNKGRVKTAETIRKIKDLKKRLENGDYKLVHEIADAVKTKYNYSFATKFCTYVSKHALDVNENKYCIYDDVLQKILPVYAYYYLGKDEAVKWCKVVNKNKPELRRIESDLEAKIKNAKPEERYNSYKKYRDLIDAIIKEVNAKDRKGLEKLTYSQFDHLLWYYFKGNSQKITKAYKVLEKNISNEDFENQK